MSPDFVNRIHQGDCIAGMNGLPEGCVDLCFADPPFNIGYKYDVYDDRREAEHYLDWSKQWIGAVHRVLKPNGSFWLAIGDDFAAELKVESQKLGFHCRSWVVWYYTFGVNCTNKFTRSHTHLFYFVKDPKAFTFRAEEAINRIPSARQLVYNDARANPHGRLPDDTWILRPQDMADCFTPEEDTWYFPRVAGTFKERAGFHGCQMPEQLLGRIIRLCSNDDDLVLDPFAGSATTLVTAKKLGRKFLGFELSEDYATRGSQRVIDAQIGAPLVGSADPTRSAPATPGRAGKRARVEESSEFGIRNSDDAPSPAPTLKSISSELRTPNSELLIESFRRACHGYSLDRVVADPKLQEELVKQCKALKLAGDAKSWNAALFRLRKSGKLTSVPTTARTELAWDECEPYLPAAEAALALLLGRDSDESLDDLLCDPARAAEFDRLAVRYGGKKKMFEYRWAALKLRKEARVIRRRAAELRRKELRFSVPIGLSRGGNLKKLPAESGLFAVFDGEGERLYVGVATNLCAELQRLLPKTRLKLFDRKGDVRVAVCPLAASWTDLLAYRQTLLAKSRTALNWQLPGDEAAAEVEPATTNGRAPRRGRRAVAESAHG
jgi:site-specific DNA-methyltransferase (adenine-specific)